MTILGIDPGTATVGYGIIEASSSKASSQKKNKKTTTPPKFKCIDFGCIETNSRTEFPERLTILSKELRKLVKEHRPQLVCLEGLFFFVNKKTAIKVSQATGVILYTFRQSRVPVIEYSPQEIKKFLTHNGWAKKEDVQKKVKSILSLKGDIKPDDAADALSIAIYGAYKNFNS